VLEMGLFNKFKKENKVEENEESIKNDTIAVEQTADNNEKIELENRLISLQDQIKEKNERLSTIVEKIELSKKEYDEIIGKIIQTKKELRSQSNPDSSIDQSTETINHEKNKISKEISDSKIKLQEIQEEIMKNSKINEELEQKIKNNEPVFSDTETQKKKINEELEQRKKELEILKKRLSNMKNSDIKNAVEGDSKNVVEAASQIIATTNKRLQDTTKELDVVRQLLDKERKAHNETKKKLQN